VKGGAEIRVVRGRPAPDELAALTVVLLARLGVPDESGDVVEADASSGANDRAARPGWLLGPAPPAHRPEHTWRARAVPAWTPGER
jgi:hypothetical protein